jgi:hypothetical protein
MWVGVAAVIGMAGAFSQGYVSCKFSVGVCRPSVHVLGIALGPGFLRLQTTSADAAQAL